MNLRDATQQNELQSIYEGIMEMLECGPCHHDRSDDPGDCANWDDCQADCALVRLRRLAGVPAELAGKDGRKKDRDMKPSEIVIHNVKTAAVVARLFLDMPAMEQAAILLGVAQERKRRVAMGGEYARTFDGLATVLADHEHLDEVYNMLTYLQEEIRGHLLRLSGAVKGEGAEHA